MAVSRRVAGGDGGCSEFFTAVAAQYGEVARFKAGPQVNYLISHPDPIARVYQQDTERYYKGEFYQLLQSAMGNGLLLSNGELWQRQRQLMRGCFLKHHVATWLDIVTATTATMLKDWETRARQGVALDVATEMAHLIQRIMVKILFGRALEHRISVQWTDAVTTIGGHLLQLILRKPVLGGVLNRLPLPSNRRYRDAVQVVNATLAQLIAEQKRHGDPDDDAIIGVLQRARDDVTPGGMSDQQLRDELVTLFLAGHDTTARALSWAFYFLSQHPEVAQQIHDEATQVLVDGTVTAADQVGRLHYTEQAVNEALRLLPPVYMVSRTPKEDDHFGPYRIAKESLVVISPYVMHRHPAYWESPERFDPTRFCPARAQGRPHYTFFPFGGGKRICLGTHLAMLEMTVIVAMVLNRFQLALVPGQRVVVQPLLTLRPRHGVKIALTPRSPARRPEAGW
ncbi:MAG: cytochrome P450 [Gammaproteobacteria bacterium]